MGYDTPKAIVATATYLYWITLTESGRRGKKVVIEEEQPVQRRDEYDEHGRRTTFLGTDDEDDDDDDDVGGDAAGDIEKGEDGDEVPYNIEEDPEYIAFVKSGKTTADVLKEIREGLKDEEEEPTEKEATHPGHLDMRVGEIIVAAKHIRGDEPEQTVEYVELGQYCEALLLSSPLASNYGTRMRELKGKKVVVVVNAKPFERHWVRSKTAMMLLTCVDTEKPKPAKSFSISDIMEEIRQETEERERKERSKKEDKDQDGNTIHPERKEDADNQDVPKENSISPEVDEMITLYHPIEVPEDSKPGSRVYFEGYANEPFPYSDQQLFEFVLRGFRVDETGFVFYKDDKPLLVEGPENGEPQKAFASIREEAPVVLA